MVLCLEVLVALPLLLVILSFFFTSLIPPPLVFSTHLLFSSALPPFISATSPLTISFVELIITYA
jgi:hypothetical protein